MAMYRLGIAIFYLARFNSFKLFIPTEAYMFVVSLVLHTLLPTFICKISFLQHYTQLQMNQDSGSINFYGELSEPMTISHSNVIIKNGVIAKAIIAAL